MANNCAACCKLISCAQYLTCSSCIKSSYHTECVNIDYGNLSKNEILKWICPLCQSKIPKTDNTLTPVRQQGQATVGGAVAAKTNVTLRPQNREPEKRSRTQTPTAQPPAAPPLDNDALAALLKEIKLLRDDMVEVKDHLRNLTSCVASCAARLDEYDNRLASSEAKIRALEIRDLENAVLHQRVSQLEDRINMQGQNSIRNEIEIQGVNEHVNENLFHVMKVTATKIGIELSDMDIDDVSRVGPRRGAGSVSSSPRPVVLRFVRHTQRQEFLKAAKLRRGITSADIEVTGPSNKLFFNERLTKENRSLFRQARLQKSAHRYSYCWTSNGRIFIRKYEGGPVIAIRGTADLERIKQADHGINSATPGSPPSVSQPTVDSAVGATTATFRDINC